MLPPMTVHAFVDESRRGSHYIVAATIARPADLRRLRKDLRCQLLPGQSELHFSHENDRRRRELASIIAQLPIEIQIYHQTCGRDEEFARQECVRHLTRDLLDRGAHRLVVDSRSSRDVHDERTISRAISRHSHPGHLVYEHISSTSEPMLSISDAVAWCFNRGASWRVRIEQIISTVIKLDSPHIREPGG
jgi:hypothetical protein